MKRTHLLHLYIFLSLLMLTVSCDKWPENGDLDGQWQLMSMEQGDVRTDTKAQHIYWCVQLDLIQLNGEDTYYAHFQHTGNTLSLKHLSFPAKYESATDDNLRLTAEEVSTLLPPYGIKQFDPVFIVVRLNSSTLILRSEDGTILRFRKF